MPFNTLQPRQLRVTFTLGANASDAAPQDSLDDGETIASPAGAASSDGSTVYVWTQNRIRARISAGGRQFNSAEIEVYGLQPNTINALSRLWLTPLNVRAQDTVMIEVLSGAQYVPLFFGSIQWCAPRGNDMPNVPIVIVANASTALAQTARPAYSASGPIALTDALSAILSGSGYTLLAASNLPQYTLMNPRARGSLQDQIATLLNGFPDISWDFYLQQLRIRPVGAAMYSDVIEIGVQTGMKGSPQYSTSGVQVATLFDPRLTLGATIQLDTVFQYANNANWVVAALQHELEANVFNGRWDTDLVASGIPNNNGSGTQS